MTEATYFEPIDLFPTHQDLIKLSNQIDKLTIDVNTQNLRVEIEKAKMQKMKVIMRQIRSEKILPNPIRRLRR